jgi:ornithine carrier protein
VEYPFDTVKVHLQTQENHSLKQCVSAIMKKEGIQGFFNGISAPLLGSMAENAILFVSYNHIQNYIRKFNGMSREETLSKPQLAMAGGMAGAIVSFVITPIELLKCRLQTQNYLDIKEKRVVHRTSTSVFLHTLREHGIRGLYSGHVGTMGREIAGGVAWFGAYENATKYWLENTPGAKSKNDLAAWKLMSAGALAGMSYNIALYPADVVKSRQQSGLHGQDGFFKVAKLIYNSQGIRGFFRGSLITVTRSAPSSGVIFLSYEWMCRTFGSESK